ncbi:MAG: deoxyguanosinetriphosphate triphosphohydrolase [Candidatus Aminicenantes bacterium]
MALTVREKLENLEKEILSEKACLSLNTLGRERKEKLHSLRTEFQRDRDRIIHCKSFRRLKHKTQVFIAPYGDHYRTRLTHTLEVSQIARTIAKALRLNEDLTEAIALGHDLGHTPFGHAGEKSLKKLSPKRFSHYTQSLRVVESLEYDGKGLNLTHEVRDGILKHSKGRGKIFDVDKDALPMTLEGQVVRVSDLIAYVNHDIDDALRAGVIKEADIPSHLVRSLGKWHAKRIDKMVWDVIDSTSRGGLTGISLSDDMNSAIVELRDFLYEKVYFSEQNLIQYEKVDKILSDIYQYILDHPENYVKPYPEEDLLEIRVIDFIAGMTDLYALNLYEKLFLPNHRTRL